LRGGGKGSIRLEPPQKKKTVTKVAERAGSKKRKGCGKMSWQGGVIRNRGHAERGLSGAGEGC